MRVKGKTKTYVPEALEYFGKCMLKVRQHQGKKIKFNKLEVELSGLERAIYSLEKSDRQQIEKFWGLTGGTNHSKRRNIFSKDVAFETMRKNAFLALSKLLTIDCLIMYDITVKEKVDVIIKKINKNGKVISDIESVKYVMAFFVYIENGPKMFYDDDLMSLDTQYDDKFLVDEFQILDPIYEELLNYPDDSINLSIIMDLLDMLDLNEKLTILKSIGIPIHKSMLSKAVELDDVEILKINSEVRQLREKMFPYGAWEVTCNLIFVNEYQKDTLEKLINQLCNLRRDWNKISEFKSGEKTLRTTDGVKTLNVYNIEGFEFTDQYEIMFLYLERNLIASEI